MPASKLSNQTTLVHALALLDAPRFGAPARTLLPGGTPLTLHAQEAGFALAETGDGQRGYLPLAACAPRALGSAGGLPDIAVPQAVTLYRHPVPGAQLIEEWDGTPHPAIVGQKERVRLLGTDEAFVLVQRESGQLGYLPAVLCGVVSPDRGIVPVGPIDLGWIFLGGVWLTPNWYTLQLLQRNLGLELVLQPYLVGTLLVLLIAAILLWWSPRPFLARSFALGIVSTHFFYLWIVWLFGG